MRGIREGRPDVTHWGLGEVGYHPPAMSKDLGFVEEGVPSSRGIRVWNDRLTLGFVSAKLGCG